VHKHECYANGDKRKHEDDEKGGDKRQKVLSKEEEEGQKVAELYVQIQTIEQMSRFLAASKNEEEREQLKIRLQAIFNNFRDVVQNLPADSKRAILNAQFEGVSLLKRAIYARVDELVAFLLSEGAFPKSFLLLLAVEKRLLRILQLLLPKSTGQLHQKAKNTALEKAVELHDEQLSLVLAENGAKMTNFDYKKYVGFVARNEGAFIEIFSAAIDKKLFATMFVEMLENEKETFVLRHMEVFTNGAGLENLTEPLLQAIWVEMTKVVDELLKKYGSNLLNFRDSLSKTPLMHAIEKRATDYPQKIFDELLRRKADVNIVDSDGKTALLLAIFSNFSDMALKLIAAGANVNVQDKDGNTAFTLAAENWMSKVVAVLMEKGAEIDVNFRGKNGYTLLMLAIAWKNYKLASGFIKAGVDVNARDEYGRTALMFAVWEKATKIAMELLSVTNIDVNVQDYEGRRTALLMAVEKNMQSVAIAIIQKENVNLNAVDHKNDTALLWAIRTKKRDVAIAIIQKGGVDLEHQNNRGETALMLAIYVNAIKVFEELIDANVNVNANYGGGRATPLMVAISEKNQNLAIELIEAGADVTVVNDYGDTALKLARRYSSMTRLVKEIEKRMKKKK